MRQILLSLIILSFAQLAYSENQNYGFYIVSDPDGWVNVREDKKIIDRLENNKLVFVYKDEVLDTDAWIPIEYEKNNTIKNGFIHKSRLVEVSNLEVIPVKQNYEKTYIFGNKSFSIKIETEPFDLTNRTLKYSSEGNWLQLIDGKYVWGADGAIPKTQYKSIEITQNGKQYYLPKNALSNLFEPSLEYTHIYYDKKTDILYITTMNGDGAGGYLVAWSIQNGKCNERLVTHGF